jgi:hypothetical protein
MLEISAASNEQSQGVAQVGQAVTQMDEVTQHNAALVEESAAAATSLKDQAQQLVQAVAFFQLAARSSVATSPIAPEKRSATNAPLRALKVKPSPSRQVKQAIRPVAVAAGAGMAMATASMAKDDWESF